ncbi:MAG: phenylacetate--CoA ligase family protein [Planctomycetes bacterium]|nr:phenylacetate--CoA ligase family protein [Planctomycetota bacterium]
MHPLIVRHVIYPFHERLVGRRTLQCLAELEASQWLAPRELRRMQERKLRALMAHAAARTPFYRDRLRRAGIDPAGRDLGARWAGVPLLSKEEIRGSLDAMLWHDAPGGLIEQFTGGSSGEPLRFYLDRRRQAYDQAARMRSHRWFGVNVGDRELYLWGSPIELGGTDTLKRLRDALTNNRLLSAFDMSPRRMEEYVDEILRYRPACLFGYPTSLALLAEHVHARGRRPAWPKLRAVFVTGEVCYPHHREAIERCFGAAVAEGYGSREAGFIAHQCPLGQRHITAENCLVEIVDGERVLPAGETGEIVVTHLDAWAMPMIRYRTGDVGRLQPGRCACGRGLPLMDVVSGRTTDFLYLPDGTVRHALSIIYPLRETPEVKQFRVTQQADYSVSVEVVPHAPPADAAAARIARRLEPVLGEQVDVDIRWVEHIETTGSGKFRYVISHARPQKPAVDAGKEVAVVA